MVTADSHHRIRPRRDQITRERGIPLFFWKTIGIREADKRPRRKEG